MIAQDRAVVDAEAVEHHGGQLIGLHIAVGLLAWKFVQMTYSVDCTVPQLSSSCVMPKLGR